ncbi:hypothetical protein G6O69_33390 [Pseudenhygromyxa sp. WMMC2535]|uniref:hypothetical protein n=1 Tax=Pseudenhygromyxa sp. WMMC2535 TaxID=2712867 RepID=UPI001555B9E3|nr:hypothetical protein [Pseudenhygromyxa sp. WMMC2535]NVB42764.1 hypothetical protein [Pseudenhygromyxa sp. WMMC2535]
MAARIDATLGELKSAFEGHRDQARSLVSGTSKPSRSAVLLRVYALECGLKAKYLLDNHRSTTKDIPEGAFGKNGHDLESGVKALKLPATAVGAVPGLRRRSKGTHVPIHRAHEALRYGADLDPQDRDALDDWLVCAPEDLKGPRLGAPAADFVARQSFVPDKLPPRASSATGGPAPETLQVLWRAH